MANSTTQLDTEQFLNEFLPYPNRAPTLSSPVDNLFDALENANTMTEGDVSKLLVSRCFHDCGSYRYRCGSAHLCYY